MVNRPRHPRKDLEQLLRLIEEHGWTVEKGSKYFKAKCPCGAHMRTVHMTPSSSRYTVNTTHWFERQPCWNEEAVR